MKNEDPLTTYDLPLGQTLFEVLGAARNSRETLVIKIRMRTVSVVDVSSTICACIGCRRQPRYSNNTC